MTDKPAGRRVGFLLLIQLVGLILPFVLLLPLGRDFMTTAAPAAGQIRAAVALLFANGAVTIWLSILIAGYFRGRSGGPGLWLAAAGVMMCVLQSVDNALIMTLLSVSERSVAAAASPDLRVTDAELLRLIRQWTHTIAILAIDVWIFSLYVLLHHRHAVSRLVTAFGLCTVLLHFGGIPLRSVLGAAPVGELGMPMAVGHLALAAWLIVKGWRHATPAGVEV